MYSIKKLKRDFTLQHGETDCGNACLLSIIKHHGGNATLDEIRRLCGTTKTGTTLLGLYQGASSLGFEASGLEAESIDNLTELEQPAILHLVINNLQHFVVFYGFSGSKVIIGDPAKGIELWKKEKLTSLWKTKCLLTLAPNKSFVKKEEKPDKYANIISWIKEDSSILLSSMFLGLLISVFSIATAIFSQKLIDVILPTKEYKKLIIGLILFGVILLIKSGLNFVRSTFLITQSKEFNIRMLSSFIKSLLHLPKSFFDSKKTGEMIARMNDTSKIQNTISMFASSLVVEFLTLTASIVAIYAYSWKIGFVVTLFLPVYLLIIWKFNKPILNTQKSVMNAYAQNESNYIDVINGITEVKASTSMGLFHKSSMLFYQFFQNQIFDLGKIKIRFGWLTEFLGIVLIVAVISFSSVQVLNESLLLGSMMAIISLSSNIIPSLARIAIFNINIQEAKVAYERMDEFTSLKPEEETGEQLKNIKCVEVKNMCFNYPGTLNLLSNINLNIKKGKIAALLGESGTGKSTILQLLQRFYVPNSGKITVDDKDISSFELHSYRNLIAAIPQEIKIFNQSLLFNIALSDDSEELLSVVKWCEQYGFDKYFGKFSRGYSTLLGENGDNISGGQKQLVGLARALYRKPQVLLMDEGTAAMDRQTEKFVFSLLDQIKQEVGILIVTHKIQTAFDADNIYLLENCEIIDSGSSKELLSRKNFFSDSFQELYALCDVK